MSYADDMREAEEHLAAVAQAREAVWLANAPLRLEYEMATRSKFSRFRFGQYFPPDLR